MPAQSKSHIRFVVIKTNQLENGTYDTEEAAISATIESVFSVRPASRYTPADRTLHWKYCQSIGYEITEAQITPLARPICSVQGS